jgi:hypothetical protein
MEAFRALLSFAATKDYDTQQFDVKTAFLNGILSDNKRQYMEQPKGFEEPGKEDWVWELCRGLYGMKQAGQIWNKTLNEAMQGSIILTCGMWDAINVGSLFFLVGSQNLWDP